MNSRYYEKEGNGSLLNVPCFIKLRAQFAQGGLWIHLQRPGNHRISRIHLQVSPSWSSFFTTTFLYRCSSAGVVEDIMMCLKASFTAAHEATRRESLAKDHVEQCEDCPLVCLSQHLYAVLKL